MRNPDGVTFSSGGGSPPPPEFGDLDGQGNIGPVRFQGGIIFLHGYGCRHCGNGFWTEGDRKRRLKPGTVHCCPHCGGESRVPETL